VQGGQSIGNGARGSVGLGLQRGECKRVDVGIREGGSSVCLLFWAWGCILVCMSDSGVGSVISAGAGAGVGA
jgi:hypothetical protein